MVLTANNIRIGYRQADGKEKVILNSLDFALQAGECVVILGQSGVGKSSLLRIFAGLDKSLSGEVQLFGKSLKPPHKDIGFLFQQPILLPWLNIWQNVCFGMNFKCRDKTTKKALHEKALTALQEVGLAHAQDLQTSQLSGGMAQRVTLARLLVQQPKIMLLDEPFSALDALNRQEMQGLICAIRDKYNTAMVMVSHDIDEALSIANRIIVLGEMPAKILGQWHLQSPTPRHNRLLELEDTRLEILSALQQSKEQAKRSLLEWEI